MFRECFPAMPNNDWVHNTFDDTVRFASITLSTEEKEEIIEISNEYRLRNSSEILLLINSKKIFNASGKRCCSFIAIFNYQFV
jgi:hypothetical protein